MALINYGGEYNSLLDQTPAALSGSTPAYGSQPTPTSQQTPQTLMGPDATPPPPTGDRKFRPPGWTGIEPASPTGAPLYPIGARSASDAASRGSNGVQTPAIATMPAGGGGGAPAPVAPAPTRLAPGQVPNNGLSDPNNFDMSMVQRGYNPLQYATQADAQRLAQLLGGTATMTAGAGGPNAPPPQSEIDFGNGFVGNTGLTQRILDLYGPDQGMRMLRDMAATANGGSTGIGTDPSLAGYQGDQAAADAFAASKPTSYSASKVMSDSPAVTGLGNTSRQEQPLGGRNVGPVYTDPLGYTAWGTPPNGGSNDGNSYGGYQGSYDPFGQYQRYLSGNSNSGTSGIPGSSNPNTNGAIAHATEPSKTSVIMSILQYLAGQGQ